jgi:type IV pilus assembly protein PilE
MNAAQRGFSLIELMIAVAVIGILAGIAYPSYRDYLRRSDRADAKTALLENAQFLERNFTVANRYDEDSAGNATDDADQFVDQSPRTPAAAKYTISLVADASTFTLTAAPVAGGPMDGDACGSFTLDNLGVKDADGSLGGVTCWSK